MQSREQTESIRQALVKNLMDEGMTHDEATLEESRRFTQAMQRFLTSGKLMRRAKRES